MFIIFKKIQKQITHNQLKDLTKLMKMKYQLFSLIVLCILQCTLSISGDQNYLVLKNDRVFALGLNIHDSNKHTQSLPLHTIRIVNDQQSIKIEIPVQINENKQHKTVNLNAHLPLFYSFLSTKGYIRPLNPFIKQTNQQYVKGYKYSKPAYHDSSVHEIYQQIQAFIKALIFTNNLNYLNLRMEDLFQIQAQINSEVSLFTINSIKIKYLFATISQDSIPLETLNILLQKTQNYDQFLSQQKVGTVQRKLYGKGLHQWVNHTITLQDDTDIQLQSLKDRCIFQFTDVLPQSTYIDADQRRIQTTNYETINIQKPAFASQQYFYKYRVPLNELIQTGVRKYSYEQPIHFRYPSPSLLNYTKVYLHSIQQARIVCENSDSSDKTSQSKLTVYSLQQNLLYERGTASLPNADISKSKFVSIATLAVCLVSALIIIRNLKRG